MKNPIVILKTDAVLPYTSIFFELDAGYWDADREKTLRKEAMEKKDSQSNQFMTTRCAAIAD